jgi:hypothetical protein
MFNESRLIPAMLALLLLAVPFPVDAQDEDEVIGPEATVPSPPPEPLPAPGPVPEPEQPPPPPVEESAAAVQPPPEPQPVKDEAAGKTVEKAGKKDGEEPQPAAGIKKGFTFGSYGRMGFGTTEEGRSVKPFEIVGHPPRLFEGNYVEVDLSYILDSAPDRYIKVLLTTAFMANFFHYSGSPDVDLAVRNLYIEVKGYLAPWLTVWAGSRMYRGDDIYLVDFWPMDMLNTIGGGLVFTPGPWEFKVHVGVNRLDDSYQVQQIQVAADLFEPRTVLFMDRQRFIVSLKGTRYFLFREGDWSKGAKVSVYGEFHSLPDGYYYREDQPAEKLASDCGWLVGAQGGVWGLVKNSFFNLWVRGSGGLASYGELSVPFGLDADKRTTRARDFLVGLSGNFEFGVGGLLGGAYLRYFRDADPNVYDLDDYWEGVLVARLQFYLIDMVHLALEVGEAFRRTTGLAQELPVFDPDTGSFKPPPHEVPSVTHAALMLIFSPPGKGTLTRPQIRLIGALQAPNAASRHLYPDEDIRSGGRKMKDNLFWTMGLQAEWWFNSSYR